MYFLTGEKVPKSHRFLTRKLGKELLAGRRFRLVKLSAREWGVGLGGWVEVRLFEGDGDHYGCYTDCSRDYQVVHLAAQGVDFGFHFVEFGVHSFKAFFVDVDVVADEVLEAVLALFGVGLEGFLAGVDRVVLVLKFAYSVFGVCHCCHLLAGG